MHTWRIAMIILLSVPVFAEQEEPPPGDQEVVVSDRPASWAQPLQKDGLPNLHQISPTLYRGAQPTAQGMRELQKMGIKTVLNLRAWHDDEDELEGTGLAAEDICFHTAHPEEEDVVKFLKIVNDPSKQPVFFHCKHGADRTGMMCAVYRVAMCGWSKDDAVKEMTTGGFGYHPIWKDVVKYVRELDATELRKLASVPEPSPSP